MLLHFMWTHYMHTHRLTTVTTLSVESNPSAPVAVEPATPGSQAITSLAWSRATWVMLVVLCGALFLDGLDLSMIGVALPSIGADLHLSADTLQWIVSGYILGYGSLLLLGGRA